MEKWSSVARRTYPLPGHTPPVNFQINTSRGWRRKWGTDRGGTESRGRPFTDQFSATLPGSSCVTQSTSAQFLRAKAAYGLCGRCPERRIELLVVHLRAHFRYRAAKMSMAQRHDRPSFS